MPGFSVNGFGKGPTSSVKPYYKYTWEVVSLFGDGIGSTPAGDKLPLIFLRDASLPTYDIDREEVQGATLTYKFAKSIKWADIKITWYDTVGLVNKLREWRRNVWTPEEGFKAPNEYKRDSVLNSLTYSWDTPNSWQLFNCWPQSIKAGDLTYTESEIKMVEVNVCYDWADEVQLQTQ